MARGRKEQSVQQDKLYFLPSKLRDRLMPFQRDGVLFGIEKNGRCLVADEMGLGKTLQALSIAFYYKEKWPLLIIVPASLRYPWIEEVEKWIPDIHPHDINLIQGGADIDQIPTAQITVVTYGLLRHPSSKLVQEALYNQKFQVVILDESHYIKNRKTASTKYIVPLLQRTTHKILLTGTPALARPEELFPQLDAIVPGQFGSWTNYAKKYCDAKYRYYGQRRQWVTDGASNLEELQQLISQRVMIRRLKKNVLTQLPPKLRQKIAFDLKESNLKKELDSTWDELNKALGRTKKTINSVLKGDLSGTESTLEESTGPSSQPVPSLSPDPLQVQAPAQAGSLTVFGILSTLYRSTCAAKIGPVRDYLKMLCQNEGLKFIVFGHHHIMMDSLAEQLMDDGVKYIRIDGQTPMQERPKLVHEFQADKRIRCALLSIKAAGVGLTLTAAKLVVFAELDWTPGTLEQCEDRAHRIGQADQVHVHYLVAKNTLDEWVWAALCKKTTVVTTTLNGKAQVLDMDHGNSGQIQCLANAEAFVPQQKNYEDLSAFLQSQPVNQKSIKDFFTPRTRKRNAENNEATNVTPTTSTSVRAPKRKMEVNQLVVIDSGEEDAEFTSPNTEARQKKKRKAQVDCNSSLLSESFDDSSRNENKTDTTEEKITCDLDEIPTPRVKRRKRSQWISKLDEGIDNMKSPGKQQHEHEALGTPQQSKDHVRATEWSCAMCTFLNNKELPYCEMCSTPKAAKQKSVMHKKDHENLEKKVPNSPVLCRASSGATCPGVVDKRDILDHGRSPVSDGEVSVDMFDSDSVRSDEPSTSHIASNRDYVLENVIVKKGENNVENCEMNAKNMLDTGPKVVIDQGDSETCTTSKTKILDSKLDNGALNKSPRTPKRITHSLGESSPTHLVQPDPCSTPKSGDPDMISAEMAAAKQLFSPGFKKVSRLSRHPWKCSDCQTINDVASEDCDGCLASRPHNLSMESVVSGSEEENRASTTRLVNLDKVPVYELLKYCCSKNTSRIYVYDQNNESLGMNFTVLDVEMNNFAELPDVLLHPENFRLARRFVREWNSLAPTKRRLVVKSGEIFASPCMMYEELKSGRHKTTQRYTTKIDTAAAAITKAEEIGGSVRVIQRPKIQTKKSKSKSKKGIQFDSDEDDLDTPSTSELSIDQLDENMKGLVQAMGEDGRPLCVQCQRPYTSQLVTSTTVKQNPWQTRFCNKLCMEKHWMKSHRGYSVQQVFQEERGICQICGLDAHQLFTRVKNTPDMEKRAKLIQDSKYKELKTETKQKMARHPQKGMFWQVDHIMPVVEGGGMCDIDNLRTLCVMCHQSVTSKLLRDRAKRRQMEQAAKCGDITAFFQTKS